MKSAPKTIDTSQQLHEAVECGLDANYYGVAISHANRNIATWYLLTVLEDSLRILFVTLDKSDYQIIGFQLDRQKYSTRFALDRIRHECRDTSNVAIPSHVVPNLYVKTFELLQAGVDFMTANQLCLSAHAGTIKFTQQEETVNIVLDEAHHDKRYAGLELLGHMPLDVIDHSSLLYVWVRREDQRPRVVDDIASSVRITGSKVIYKYNLCLAVELSQTMMQRPSLVPEGWCFPWGGRYETNLLVNALCVRCMYHWIAIHFGATFKGMKGGGEASLLYVTTLVELEADLQKICSLNQRVVRSFVQFLTYGNKMLTPDPALQPIIKLGNGFLGIPCLMFLSSNYERNLLAIQARINSDTFDRLSKLFESNMVCDILTEIKLRWPFVKGNVRIRDNGKSEEIDLLVADPSSQTIMVCELRWMLQPGDTREVQIRKKVCQEKVTQVKRKVQWLQSRVAKVLDVLDVVTVDFEDWKVEGVVVIKTFGGTLSRDVRFPIMTERIFLQGMKQVTSLRHFAEWSQSLVWLPQEDLHFCIKPQEIDLRSLGKSLTVLGIEKICTPQIYAEFVNQSLRPPVSPVLGSERV